jgi:hypothetical protein
VASGSRPLRKLPVTIENLFSLPECEGHMHLLEWLMCSDAADPSFFSAREVADELWHWLCEEPTHILQGFP